MDGGGSNDVFMDRYYRLHYPEGATQYDDIPAELSEIFDPHWGQYPPQHPIIGHIGGIAYMILWLLSFFGNGLVIYVFLKTKTLRTPTNMFVVNLAFSDACMMTTQGMPVTINIFIQKYWCWGVLGCKIYAFVGGMFGLGSLLTMVLIGFDRYNVIVKGFSGTKITHWKAAVLLIVLWVYCTAVTIPPFLGWGGYATEGILLTCSYDYLKEDWNRKSFVLYAILTNFCLPLVLITVFYSQIVKAVIAHEAALRAQAKKMNVDSLRSGDRAGESAEVKIAKVAITNVLLWLLAWCPYTCVVFIGAFVNKAWISPIVSTIPAFMAKTASALNPMVYAISHPKFREALAVEVPCLGIGTAKVAAEGESKTVSTTKC